MIGLSKESILHALPTSQVDEPLIVVFSDRTYLEVLLNWLIAVDRLSIKNYLVVSLDQAIHEYLLKRKVPTVLLQIDKRQGLGGLWVSRAEVFSLICNMGIDFIHSDADAVLMRDPIVDYFQGQERDLIVSQGTVWPPFVLQHWGFVLCCGLFQVRSNSLTKALLTDLLSDIRITGDDQISMNKVLMERNIQWTEDPSNLYTLKYKEHQFNCYRNMISGYSPQDGLTISMLPQHLFQRLPMQEPDVYVKHLLSPKENRKKMEMFASTGCMLLSADWKNIDYDRNSLQRLSASR